MKVSCLAMLAALSGLIGCNNKPKVERVEWPIMGTIAAVQTRGGSLSPEVLSAVKAEFNRVNEEFNVYNPNAPIHKIAQLSDADIMSLDMAFPYACYGEAFALRDASGGAFNPRWRGPGTLDMGAIAKGFAVDLAADAVREIRGETTEKLPDLLIDLGGNLKAVKGDWTVGVRDGGPFILHEGEACATSARYFRGNHIKDGRTGEDVLNGVYSVTLVHPRSAMRADGLSTTLFILGRSEGEAFLKKYNPKARAIWVDAGF